MTFNVFSRAREDVEQPRAEIPAQEPWMLDVSLIDPNPENRKFFDEDDLRQLGESMRDRKQVQPVVVYMVDGRYMLEAGERRWRAAKLVGLTHLWAVLSSETDELKIALSQADENVHRTNLTMPEDARHLHRIFELLKARAAAEGQAEPNQKDLAEIVKRDATDIGRLLRLAKMPELLKWATDHGIDDARSLLTIQQTLETGSRRKRERARNLMERIATKEELNLRREVAGLKSGKHESKKRWEPTKADWAEIARWGAVYVDSRQLDEIPEILQNVRKLADWPSC